MGNFLKTILNGIEKAVAIPEGHFVGRKTGGNLGPLTPSEAAAMAFRRPPGHIDGLVPSFTILSQLVITPGSCRDDADSSDIILAAALEKQISSGWAAGDGNGGLDTGTVAANTAYHVWVIRRSDTGAVDGLLSLSATAPTMPTNYDAKRRVGAIITDGSSNVRVFETVGSSREVIVQLVAPIQSFADSGHGGAETLRTLNVPTGLRVMAHVRLSTQASSESMIGGAAQSLPTPTGVGWDDATGVDQYDITRDWRWIMTDTSGRIKTRTDTGRGISMHVLGWRDFR